MRSRIVLWIQVAFAVMGARHSACSAGTAQGAEEGILMTAARARKDFDNYRSVLAAQEKTRLSLLDVYAKVLLYSGVQKAIEVDKQKGIGKAATATLRLMLGYMDELDGVEKAETVALFVNVPENGFHYCLNSKPKMHTRPATAHPATPHLTAV